MARPVTQHPPSALQFPSASRPSNLGFGFGAPLSRSPFGDIAAANLSTPLGPHSPWPIKQQVRAGPSTSTNRPTPRAMKRSRNSSSPSPTSPRSPSISPTAVGNVNPASTTIKHGLSVHNLAIADTGSGRSIKRSRQVAETSSGHGEIDLGLMLATLPPSAHLQILTSLLDKEPSIRSKVLALTPPPDLVNCTDELHSIMDRLSRHYGDPSPDRYHISWTRAETDIITFSRTALSYLSFFYAPHLGNSVGPSVRHTLLYTITKHTTTLVRLLPPNVGQIPATAALSQLVNTLISRWRDWLAAISKDVNENGEIYPYTLVSGWAQNFGELISGRNGASQCPDPGPINAFVDTISELRDTFSAQVGWLVGPGSNF